MPLGAAIFAALAAAGPSGLLSPDAHIRAARRQDDEEATAAPLLLDPALIGPDVVIGHRSHSSHRSHRSHTSGGRTYAPVPFAANPDPSPTPPSPAPTPPKPGVVTLVAIPGGRIFVDGKAVGEDATAPLVLSAGEHEVRIDNRFLGSKTISISIADGERATRTVEW